MGATMINIDVPNNQPHLNLTVPLDGTSYLIRLRWNMRSGWYIGLSTAEGTVITSPRRLGNNWPVLPHATSALRPPGVLWVAAPSEAFAGLAAWGKTHFLIYNPAT